MLHHRNRSRFHTNNNNGFNNYNDDDDDDVTSKKQHHSNCIEDGVYENQIEDNDDKYKYYNVWNLFQRKMKFSFGRGGEWNQRMRNNKGYSNHNHNCYHRFVVILIFMITIQYSFRRLLPPTVTQETVIKLKIDMFDSSKINNDLGGFLYPAKYQQFASYKRIMKLEDPPILNTTLEYVPDYGGLQNMQLLSTSHFQRSIQVKDDDSNQRPLNHNEDDDDENENSQDEEQTNDKKKRSHPTTKYADDDTIRDDSCRPTEFHSIISPNCNYVHEIDFFTKLYTNTFPYQEPAAVTFSSGFYRDAWSVITPAYSSISKQDQYSVMKTFKFSHPFALNAYENSRKDALIMERLTKSPRIIDIYAHCAMTVVVEAMQKELEDYAVPGSGLIKQEELHDEDDVQPQNKFTPTQKLKFSLEMAEGIADLHGFEGGVIVHDDVQLCQWLHDKDGKLKLGDFNRAEVMLWDEKSNKYCKYTNGKAFGDVSKLMTLYHYFAHSDCFCQVAFLLHLLTHCTLILFKKNIY